MTSGERKALLFLAGVAVLGGVARVVASPAPAPTAAERGALRDQIGAVDSARRAPPRASDRRHASRRKRVVRDSTSAPTSIQSAPPPADTPIDVDVADARALEALPGVGPALARRIVADREARGAFGSLAGLERVRGVGPALARRVASHVTFSGVSRPSGAGAVHSP